ncbi:MAG: quinoprotein dehydrogenase-associated putative ABC transporter substrate-binding protein [Proteobacteria bacterium]|nr:quinoprotein dehydrogenase-associated putative ABC transporter substrate-binding protein [Pseudomonadota bacterium]
MHIRIISVILLSTFFLQAVFAEDELPDAEYLKVCADGYMLPFSNKKEEGYENKIAQLFAKKLGLKLKYEFFPQRMGFIRNTLRAESEERPGYKCDLVISVPSSFELAATTEPYYRSTWVLVFAKGRGLDDVTEPQMLAKVIKENKPDFKIGLPDRGSPAQLWVFYQELMSYMVPYQGQPGDIKVSPGHTLIKDIIDGKIDAAIIWGPTAGYYANKYKDRAELVLLPVKDDTKKNREMKFSYSISMAVRYGEKAWQEKINNLIKENQTEIEKILTDYGVPLVK